MKLSVAMATYNGEKFIKEQLTSILNQTRLPDEIMISDDASTDKTPEILMEYKEKYPKLIKLLLNKENVGFVKNFERAIMNSTGDLVALSDQDDVWLPEKLEKECKVLEEHQDVGMVFCNLKIVDEKLNGIGRTMWENNNWKMNGNIIGTDFFKQLLKGNRVTGCTMVLRKKILNDLIPFDNRVHLHDYWLALGSSLASNVFAIREALVLYRQHSNNQIGCKLKISYDQYLANLKKEKKRILSEKIFSEYLDEYIRTYTNDFLTIKNVKGYKIFTALRFELYSSQFALSRIKNIFKLFLKINFYDRKRVFFRDITMVFSSKIRIIRFYLLTKLKKDSK